MTYLKNLSQLITEFDHYASGSAKQRILYLANLTNSFSTPHDTDPNHPQMQGQLVRSSFGIQYQFLKLQSVPIELEYNHVVIALCIALESVYRRITDPRLVTILRNLESLPQRQKHRTQTESLFPKLFTNASDVDAVIPDLYYEILSVISEIDSNFNQWVFIPLLRELTDAADEHIKASLSSLTNLRTHLYTTKSSSSFTEPLQPFLVIKPPNIKSRPNRPTVPPPPPPTHNS